MFIKNKNKDLIQLVIFQLGMDVFGVDIKDVDEIIKVTNITRIPRSPKYLLGVANLRGTIFPVFDIHQRFGLGKCSISETSRILVVNINGNKFGLVIDEIKEVIRLRSESIESATAISKNIKEEFLEKVIKLKDKGRAVMVLKLSSLCSMNIEDDLDIAIAKEKEKILTAKSAEVQLVSFVIAGEEYAIKIKSVREIIRLSGIVRVPNTPDYVRGLISHRDNLLPVIDLRMRFNKTGLKMDEYSNTARIAVVDLHTISFGLLVDRMNGLVRINKQMIETPPDFISSVESNQLSGIVKLNKGNRLVMLLNLENIVSLDEIRRIKSSEEIKHDRIEKGTFKTVGQEVSLITFKMEKEEFAIKIDRVQEINRYQDITKIPNTIHFMEGVINLRGEIIPVFSLRKRFGLIESSRKNKQKMIIVQISDKKAGLLVDSVSEVLHIENKTIESIPDAIKSKISMEFMSGIIRLPADKRILILLNLEMALSVEEKKHFLGMMEGEVNFSGFKMKDGKMKNEISGEKQNKFSGKIIDEISIKDKEKVTSAPKEDSIPVIKGFEKDFNSINKELPLQVQDTLKKTEKIKNVLEIEIQKSNKTEEIKNISEAEMQKPIITEEVKKRTSMKRAR